MKSLLAFIQKEFRHILRDRWTLLIIVGMPIAQLLLFGFAITTEVRNASVAVFDPVNDELTTRIIERMNASEYFNVSERITDIDRINDIFREGKTSLVMVFSDNFSNDVLNGEASDHGLRRQHPGHLPAGDRREKRNGRSGDHPGHQNAL